MFLFLSHVDVLFDLKNHCINGWADQFIAHEFLQHISVYYKLCVMVQDQITNISRVVHEDISFSVSVFKNMYYDLSVSGAKKAKKLIMQ